MNGLSKRVPPITTLSITCAQIRSRLTLTICQEQKGNLQGAWKIAAISSLGHNESIITIESRNQSELYPFRIHNTDGINHNWKKIKIVKRKRSSFFSENKVSNWWTLFLKPYINSTFSGIAIVWEIWKFD